MGIDWSLEEKDSGWNCWDNVVQDPEQHKYSLYEIGVTHVLLGRYLLRHICLANRHLL